MKKFKTLFEADAKDYVRKDDSDEEGKGEKLPSKKERDFAKDHEVEKTDHPTAGDVAHTAPHDADGHKEKGGEKKPLKSYKDHIATQGTAKARKGDKKQGDIKAEKVKEGFITLQDGSEIELDEMTAEKWNGMIPDLNDTNKNGLADLAIRDLEGFNSVKEFVGV